MNRPRPALRPIPWFDAQGEPLYPEIGLPTLEHPKVAELVETHELLFGALLEAHPDLLIVQPAGNDGAHGVDAALNLLACAVRDEALARRVLCVSACGARGTVEPYSNPGGDPLTAPGGNPERQVVGLGYAADGPLIGLHGTSAAAALVAGAAGLMLSVNEGLSAEQLHDVLVRWGPDALQPETGGYPGQRVLDAAAAVGQARACRAEPWQPELAGCCTPVCGGRQCGPDPACGADCGACGQGQVCVSGACFADGVLVVNAGDDESDGACDAAHCSLREALELAAGAPGPHTVAFARQGDELLVIEPTQPLPTIAEPVHLSGGTLPGHPARPAVVLSGDRIGPRRAEVNGLELRGGASTVQGLVVSGFQDAGILLAGASGSRVQGCFLGTDASGGEAVGNGVGLRIEGASDTLVGGTDPGDGNVVSGNRRAGIAVHGGIGNRIVGNLVGTDAAGALPLENGAPGCPGCAGIDLHETVGAEVGCAQAGCGNVIAASKGSGIDVRHSREVVVQGNRIGTDAGGVAALGHDGAAVRLIGSSECRVGGSGEGEGNQIAASDVGVWLYASTPPAPSDGNRIEGNRIGTDADGASALGNGRGVVVDQGSGNRIGGPGTAGNLVSGNKGAGVVVRRPASGGNRIQGNRIGTATDGEGALGNGAEGVRVGPRAAGTLVGGSADGEGNRIAFNHGAGVRAAAEAGLEAARVSVLGNRIHSNGGLGIDRGGPGLSMMMRALRSLRRRKRRPGAVSGPPR